MSEFSVRTARVADRAALLRLSRCLAEFHDQQGSGGAPVAEPVVRQLLRALVLNRSCTVLVAEIDGRVVGCASTRLVLSPLRRILAQVSGGARVAHVDVLVVEDGHRGRGIGTSLLDAVCRWARDRGARNVDLQVHEFNSSAAALYEREGWCTTGRTMTRALGPG
ncbi:GNAT family N-acetyltransferase [Kineococcus sp. G2]|uniref:GNAT family N-acetyltransferase n=1 Tax=Kineococcus sp. G2 TaxID=3127484 RepID=UPI00301DAF69